MSDAAATSGTIQTFATAIGAAIGGPPGALAGGVVGWVLVQTLPTLYDVAVGVAGNLATPPVEQLIRRVRRDPQINHDLQTAYRDAVRAALADIGGRECFPDAWRTERPVPNGVVYPHTPGGHQLWQQQPEMAAQLAALLAGLDAAIAAGTALPLSLTAADDLADVRTLLDATTPADLAAALYAHLMEPCWMGHGGLRTELAPFGVEPHLHIHLLDRTLFHLGELLKQRTPAWRAFNRHLLEELHRALQEQGGASQAILAKLDALLARPATGNAPVDALADMIAVKLAEQGAQIMTRLDDIRDGINAVLASNARLEERAARIEDKVDRLRPTPGSVRVDVPSRRKLFVGRKALLNRIVKRLLAGQDVALWGAAGIGKSTLAVVAAEYADVLAACDANILWGGLGLQPDALGVTGRWATALGVDVTDIPTVAGRSQAVKNALGGRASLVVLDDAWDGKLAGEMRCGRVHLLTTRDHDLALAFAGANGVLDVPDLTPTEAWRLIKELAPTVCKTNATAVRGLLKVVGYLPLAVELLGGYLAPSERGVFGVLGKAALDEMAAPQRRLALAQARLGDLRGGPISLQATIELSLSGLPEPATHAFYALGAFAAQPATFDLAAALAVSGADAATLARLVNRSLVNVRDGEWLSLHQVIVETARTHTPRAAVERHRDHYLALVNADRDDWQRIEAAYDQIRHAWVALSDEDDHIHALLDALGNYQDRHGLWAEREAWLERGLRQDRARRDRRDEGITLNNLGNVYQFQGRWDDAIAAYERSLAIKRTLGDRHGEGQTLNNLGSVYRQQGRWGDAIAAHDQSLAIFCTLGDRHGEGQTLTNLGIVYQVQGRWDDAIAAFERSLAICRTLGDRHGEGSTLTNLGNVYQVQGRWDDAIAAFERSLAIKRTLGDRHGEGITLNNLGNVYQFQGRWDDAIAAFERSLAICRTLGNRHGEGITLINLGIVYGRQERWADAIAAFEQALAIFRTLGDRHGEGQTLNNLGVLYERQGDTERAATLYAEALSKLHPDSPEYRRLAAELRGDAAPGSP